MYRTKALFAAVALAGPGVAQAAEPPCLTPTEFSGLAGYALPSVISGTTKRCSQTLDPTAFLNTQGAALSTRYAANRQATWPQAKAAFLKLSAGQKDVGDVFSKMPDKSLEDMLDVILEGMVSQEISPDKCPTIDKFIRLLSPLPAENTAQLITMTVGLVSDSRKEPARLGKITICKS